LRYIGLEIAVAAKKCHVTDGNGKAPANKTPFIFFVT
jgi:hypothetical protein